MIGVILFIILIIIFVIMIKKVLQSVLFILSEIAVYLITSIMYITIGVFMGPLLLFGLICDRLCEAFRIRELMSYFIIVMIWVLMFVWGCLDIQPDFVIFGFDLNPKINVFSLDVLKLSLPACLFPIMIYCHRFQLNIEARSEPLDFFKKSHSDFFTYFFSIAFCLVVSMAIGNYWPNYGWIYYITAIAFQLYIIDQEVSLKKLAEKIYEELIGIDKLNATSFLQLLTNDSNLKSEDVKTLFQGIAAKLINSDTLEEIELHESQWFFNKYWYQKNIMELNSILAKSLRHSKEDLTAITENLLGLPSNETKDFVERYLYFGSYYAFNDGQHFVVDRHTSRLNTCVSCGLTEVVDERSRGEWHCSIVCKETEDVCLTIKNKPIDIFMAEASTDGFVLMAGANAWSENHKIFATGGQGHGFAAEQGNNKIDRLMGRDAQVIGGDNAKNGADRIVQGQQIQTKYFSTGARSVGAAFDGQQGVYRYLDNNGKPMQLEVPKDQYEKAIETMKNKIKDGKVPGISDPKEAEQLIRKGHLTYTQAQNITKFGTIESIGYDVYEGVIVGTTAAGISFSITSLIYYLKTKDQKEAIRVAVIQAGNTFGKTLTISITTQQLHRLSGIQNVLKHVDVCKLSPTVSNVLQKGMGLSKAGINNALRGTLLTSVVLIAFTTGPDMLKLIRGRISQAQFLKNLIVISSGMAGGVIGSVAGGFLFSPMGPAGVVMGRLAGGVIGGIIASTVSNTIANNLIEDDRVKMLSIIQIQMEYLAITFMLTEEEIDNFNANLENVINQKTLEVLFAAENKRAMANFFLKPVVVTVVKQRPALTFGVNDVIDACDEWVV